MSNVHSIQDAVNAANRLPDSGVGVSLPPAPGSDHEPYVQWVLRTRGAPGFDTVEVNFGAKAGAAEALSERGFAPDPELGHYGIWCSPTISEQSFASADLLVAYLVDLLRLVGAEDGMAFKVYP